MRLILFGLMLVLPIMEIAVFIVLGRSIGLWPTLIGIVATALIGSAVIRHQGIGIIASARSSLAAGEAPVGEMLEGLALLVAGALLVTPGFVTDTLGFLLLVPKFRRSLAQGVVGTLARQGQAHVFHGGGATGGGMGGGFGGGAEPGPRPGSPGAGGGVIIDGEWRDLEDDETGAANEKATGRTELSRMGTDHRARGR